MRILGLFAAAVVFCTPAFAYELTSEDKAELARVEAYLSGIHTVEADFIQADPNGTISTGKFYLSRPGRLRMEYAPPTPVLMVATGGYIIYYDKELDQVSRILLDSTLVGFLARDHIKFDDQVTVINITHGSEILEISLVQTAHPTDGTLTLDFSQKPLTLHTMIVKDRSGQITTVSLNNARFNVPLADNLFVFHDPHLGGHRPVKN